LVEIDRLTETIIGLCMKIHSSVGPGCLERVYEEILYFEICKRNIPVRRQVLMPIVYEQLTIPDAFKVDLLIDNRLILEIKSIESIAPVHFKIVMTYLNLMNLKNGMILNFKVNRMKEGIHRIFNNSGF
jgi:GxxExxY protein